MLINQVLVTALESAGYALNKIPERDLSSYSWPELLGLHPSAQSMVAGLVGAGYCASFDEFEAGYTPNLAMHPEESDIDYDLRLASYLECNMFPAKVGSILESDAASGTVWICENPLIEAFDIDPNTALVLASRDLIHTVLKGSRSEMTSVAPHLEGEPIESWTNRLIAATHARGAADVEISSHISTLKIRLKIGGEWTDWVGSIPLTQRGPLLRSLCASATPSLDYEAGADHDFKLEKRINGIDTSWRGSITPAALGDSVTLRMLAAIGRVPSIEDLGYNEQAVKLLRAAKSRKDGLILVTGSTGHGKTTTLYSLVTEMVRDLRKVFTVEDPIESIIPGAIQKSVLTGVNIDEKYRTTFASGIRTSLRHAPDVLVVGETRDAETAMAAVGAARTGHLTFTTLHTSSVRVAIKRMIDLGIQSANLADTLTLVVSQNLVNKLCPHCRIEHEDGTCSRKVDGCSQCRGRGYLGRTVIYEMAAIDEEAREAIIDGNFAAQFERLKAAGLYISKKDIAQNLISAGVVDRLQLEDFLRA